tara:strand:+ start:397 stop:768 length:372 start_codon:yes stop_codon:yes gene_type:complete
VLESFSPVIHNLKTWDKLSLFCGLTKGGAALSLPPADGQRGVSPDPWRRNKKGSESLLTEIRIRKGETLDKALRRLKKRLDRENVIKDARNNRYYEKPSVRRRRKMKVAKFSQMLRTRYAHNS